MGELETLRQELSKIDRELLDKFVQRMAIVDRVAELKGTTGDPVFVPEQEERVVKRFETMAPLELGSYTRVFARTLMRLSRERQYEWIMNSDMSPAQLHQEVVESQEIKVLAVPRSVGWDDTASGKVFVSGARIVMVDGEEDACRQVTEGITELAILPWTEKLVPILEKHALFIQACLSLEQRCFLVGPKLSVPSGAENARFLILLSSIGSLPLVMHVLGDLGLDVVHVRSLRDLRVWVEFCADPTKPQTQRALYQIQKEVREVRLLGCCAHL